MKNYLKWHVVFILSTLIFFVSGATGIIESMWEGDITKLSFFILILFLITSLKCGRDIYKLEKNKDFDPRRIEFGWFMSEVFLSLGMVGTIIGFIFIMKDFSSVNFENVSTIQELIKSLGTGVSTALYTTLVGLVTNIATKVQYFIFESAVEESDDED
jgi:uncharacterized membrane protein YtjA (UPF0391 family)